MKRFFALLLGLVTLTLFSGCDSVLGSVDATLAPPSLTEQQSAVYEAVTAQLGDKLQLCYPKNGEYRSAFIIRNIDSEPTEEALCFYMPVIQSNFSSELRVNVLDRDEEGNWYSACDIAGSGSTVDRVEFGNFGPDGEYSIVIGYDRGFPGEKLLTVCTYQDGMLKSGASYEYETFSLLPLPGLPGTDESRLVFLDREGDSEKRVANLVGLKDGGFRIESRVEMLGAVEEYRQVLSGKITENQPALFFDGTVPGGLCTQILTLNGGRLINLTDRDTCKQTFRTTAIQELYAADIDLDGIIEIPVTVEAPVIGDEEPMYYTDWLHYSAGGFKAVCSDFISLANGYRLSVPDSWKKGVAIRNLPEQNEIGFFLAETEEELLRIRAIQRPDEEQNAVKQGFFKIGSAGQIIYMGKINIEVNNINRLTKGALLRRFSTIL